MAGTSPDVKSKAETLLAVFERQNDDGTYLYSDREVREFLPLLVLAAGETIDGIPHLMELMGQFASKLGLQPEMDREQIQRAVETYYAENPLNPRLLAAFQTAVHETVVGSVSIDAVKAFAKFAGDRPDQIPDGSPPPEGSIKGGPLARFQLEDKQ